MLKNISTSRGGPFGVDTAPQSINLIVTVKYATHCTSSGSGCGGCDTEAEVDESECFLGNFFYTNFSYGHASMYRPRPNGPVCICVPEAQ